LNEHVGAGRIVYDGAPGRNWHNYVITGLGCGHAETLIDEIDPDVWEYLRRIVTWAKSLRFSELIGAIYAAYPDFARNSIFAPPR